MKTLTLIAITASLLSGCAAMTNRSLGAVDINSQFPGKTLSVSGTQLPIAQEIKLSLYVSSVPEPTTSLMFGAGLLLIAGARFISKTNHA